MKLVSGFGVLLSLLVLAGCTNHEGESPKVPRSAPFGWQLKSVTATAKESVPEIVRQIGFRNSWRAEYVGPGVAHADLYRLNSEAAGLEMTQRWRPRANTVTLFERRYFIVVAWEQVDRAALTALITAIQKDLRSPD
jgi:hypothetical protein